MMEFNPTQTYPKPKRKVWPWILGLAVLLVIGFVVLVVGAMGAGLQAAGQALASTPPAASGQAGADPVAKDNTLGTADYTVGTATNADKKTLKPGTYVVKANRGPCYWARVRSWDGEVTSIITNNNIDEGKTQNVTVKKTDKGLHLQGYCLLTVA